MEYTRKRHEALVAIADRNQEGFFKNFFIKSDIGAVIVTLIISILVLIYSVLQFRLQIWLYLLTITMLMNQMFLFENIYCKIWNASKMIKASELRTLFSEIAGKENSEILVPKYLECSGRIRKSDLPVLDRLWDIINTARKNVDSRILDDVLYLRLEKFFKNELEGYITKCQKDFNKKIEDLENQNCEIRKEIDNIREKLKI